MRGPTHVLPGLVLTEHVFDVPLDHDRVEAGEIQVFGREVGAPGSGPPGKEADDLPWLVFLQGGPGFGSPRPLDASGWLGRAMQEYRVLLLDQRGTARSTPVTPRALAARGSPEDQAAYLEHFRSDSIVRDCELIRAELTGGEPWSVLGQSYGGFCATRYLSAAPEGLREVFVTGGLPPLEATAEDIYRRTYRTCAAKNEAYYRRYPEDMDRMRRIVDHLAEREVKLPCGETLSVRRFQMLGLLLGFSDGFETIHYLVEQAFVDGPEGPEISRVFAKGFENTLHHDTNPIFAVLHEACYTQGSSSGWAAERIRAEHPEFDPTRDGPVYFTGEAIYPWMFEEIGVLRPMAEAAELLARKADWPVLYDREALAANTVPTAAAVYVNDMYVDREYSLETARSIRGLRTWVTDEYEHNGLRSDGEKVLGRLIDLARGRA